MSKMRELIFFFYFEFEKIKKFFEFLENCFVLRWSHLCLSHIKAINVRASFTKPENHKHVKQAISSAKLDMN